MTFAGSDNAPSAEDDAVDDSDAEGDIPALTFSEEEARALLHRQLAGETQPNITMLGSTMRKSSHRDQYNRAMHISSCLWSSGAVRTVSANNNPAPPQVLGQKLISADTSWKRARRARSSIVRIPSAGLQHRKLTCTRRLKLKPSMDGCKMSSDESK